VHGLQAMLQRATATESPSPSARDTGLFTARTAGGPPDLERPEEWERQGFGCLGF
jgi:hypothetical protein